tara:strand:+ start:6535 stop:8352 length:1818 start_codon:yes stop_codon:yes gene_type:complete
MARVLTRSNRPIVIQEPQSGLDTFLTEIAKYASPEYQQQQKLNERADARFELEKQQVSDARQKYINQQAEKNQERILEQTRYNEAKRIQDSERKYVSSERLKKQIDEELSSLPISSFQEDGSVNTFNSIIKSIIPSESNDEFGIGDMGIEYSQNKYNKKKILSDNAYAQADMYKPNFPELTRDQLAKSISSGDVVDLISNKIDKQGSLTDIEKDELKGLHSKVKNTLEIIGKSQEQLDGLDPSEDGGLYNSITSNINRYREDINSFQRNINSIYSRANQKEFSIVDDNQDFSGANLDIGELNPKNLTDNRTSFEDFEDSFADELAFLEDDNIFISEEQEGRQLSDSIDEVLANSKSVKNEDAPFLDFDNPLKEYEGFEFPEETIPAISEQDFLSAVNSGEIKTEQEAREKIFGKETELPSFVPEILKANQNKLPAFNNNGSESKTPIPDRFLYPPELVNPLQQSQVVEPPMDKEEEKRIKSIERNQRLAKADEFNFKNRQIINVKNGDPINISKAVSLVSKNLNKINKLKNNYNKSEGNKKLILAKGIAKEQSKMKELINDYIANDGTFKDEKFDEDFYNKLSSRLNMSSSELKKLISFNMGLNI